jgi:hypothetical protein
VRGKGPQPLPAPITETDQGFSTYMVEFLYLAGYESNPVPVAPPAPEDGPLLVAYKSNPPSREIPLAGDRRLTNTRIIYSTAGSGGFVDHQSTRYPHLLAHVSTPLPSSQYSPGTIGSVQGVEDSSYLSVPLSGFKVIKSGNSYSLAAVQGKIPSVEAPSLLYRKNPGSKGSTGEIVVPGVSEVEPVTMYPIKVANSRVVGILPNLTVEDGRLFGTLVCLDGPLMVETKFGLLNHPVVK